MQAVKAALVKLWLRFYEQHTIQMPQILVNAKNPLPFGNGSHCVFNIKFNSQELDLTATYSLFTLTFYFPKNPNADSVKSEK